MSTDDFQTKYTSFMESVVKSTIAETTKLFETMVEELKAELSKVKTENEALKTICRQTEAAKIVAITWSGQSSCPKMRDIAVQCDPLPSFSMSEMQSMEQRLNEHNEQCNEDDLVYNMLKDHNYDTAKDDNSKDSKPTMVNRVTQSIAADSTPSATCETDTEGKNIYQHCLNIEVKKPSLEMCGLFLPEEQGVEPIPLDIQHKDEQNALDLLENTTTWGTEGPINEIIEEREKLSIKVKQLEKTLMKTLFSPTKLAGDTEQVKNLTSNCEGVKPSCWVTEVSPDQTEKDVTLVLPSMEQGTSRTSKIIESHNATPLTPSVFSLSEEVLSSYSQDSNLVVKKPVADAANTVLSPPLRSQQLRDVINSLKPRDVMQLVEAGDSMDCTTSQGKTTTPDQCTVSFATLPSGVQCLILNPNLSPLLPTTANLSDKGTEEGFPNKTPFVPYTTDTNYHLQLIKNEFIAQLAVSPGIQDYHKASMNESKDGKHLCNDTSSLRKLQEKTGVTNQQCHTENHPQAKVRKATPEQRSDPKFTQNSTKKPRLESDTATENRTTDEPISICTDSKSLSPTQLTNVFSQVGLSNQQNTDINSRESRTTFQLVSVGTQHTGVSPYSQSKRDSTCKVAPILPLTDSEINITHENTAKDGFKSDSLKIEDTFESITKNTEKPFRAKNVAIQTLESNIYLRSKLTRETTDRTILKSQQTKRSTVKPSLNKYADNRLNVPGLRSRSCTTNNTMPLRNKHSPEIRNKSVTAKVNSIVKTTQLNCPPEQSGLRKTPPTPRTRSTRKSTWPKFPPPGQNRSSLTKDIPLPKTAYCESLRSYTFSKESSSKQMKVQSRSLLSKTVSLSAVRAKMTKNCSSNTREATAKKSRLNSPCSISKNTVKIQNAKELANPAKGKTMAKNKQTKSNRNNTVLNFYNIDEASELVRTSFEARTREATSFRETRSSLSIQRDKRTARAQNCFPVSPPTLSNQFIYVKAPTVVSPFQPLAVIGERLLKNQCGECGRVLSSTAALESHVSVHTGHRPFLCALCGKSFPDAKGLKRHGRVHRDERIHVCQECGKGFVYGFGLTKHIQMVHGKVKPFPCQICNKSFFTKRDVEIHLRIHTGEKPFHCNLCDKKFARKVELNVHLRWHNGEKRHWCPFCGKGFLDYNNLKRHKYIHTGEKPHSCPHCPKHFTQSGHLKKHVKNVHKAV
ncbi:uncharacterized protein LOC144198068 [Stigmatopora nigra]